MAFAGAANVLTAVRRAKGLFRPSRLRLEDRIVHFFVALLMAIQLATFLGMRYAIDESARKSLRDGLEVGARVFDRLLLTQGLQLTEAAKLVTADFGFREAVATRDRKTIVSALENHAARYKSSRMALVGLDGNVVADSLQPGNAGRRFQHFDLMSTQTGVERGPSIRVIDGKPHQVVVVPVRAPLTIGWVAMMLAIDTTTARDLERLVNAGVAFAIQDDASMRVVATTLGTASRDVLAAQLPQVLREGRTGMMLHAPGATYRTLSRPLDDANGTRIHAVLLHATEDTLAPFRVLEVTALLLTGLALALTLGGSIRIAHLISRPVRRLGEAARQVASGNYQVRVGANGGDEIADLSRAFNQMANGLFERDLVKKRLGRVREQRDDLARISKGLAHEASRDSLTGLANRGALDLNLAAWHAEHRPVAVLLVDVDDFGEINDRHSTFVGDRVLQVVGALVHATCRPEEIAARYGASEFVIAIPDPSSAIASAERLRSVIEAYPWHGIKTGLAVTVSIGVSESRPGGDWDESVERARAALESAGSGRNRVRATAP